MRRGIYGGTAGKARKHRNRNKADQSYENLLIDDWREPEDSARRERVIPIRRRNDFLPAVACSSDLEDTEFGTQLDLPLQDHDNGATSTRPNVLWPPHEAGSLEQSRLAAPVGPLCGSFIRFQPKPTGTARFRGTDRTTQTPPYRREDTHPRRPLHKRHAHEATARPVTVRGFAYGCLLGSAAAAIALALLDSLL